MLSNPFAALSASVPPAIMQVYVVVMALLVVAGTLLDVYHKQSATYFFNNWRDFSDRAKRQVGSVRMASLAVQTAVIDVMASGEFCNVRRRIAHLLTMYGFVLYVVTTIMMVFAYPTPATATPASVTALWYIGCLLVCGGGYWFWFFIRVDVVAEGRSPFRFVRADLFVVALVLSVSFALVWALVQATGSAVWSSLFLGLYLMTTTVLFGSIPWSKFSHMFFKPAAALEKRVAEANGTMSNLPPPANVPRKYGGGLKHARHY
jgi:uncharacterized membrane protein (DUF485 family)